MVRAAPRLPWSGSLLGALVAALLLLPGCGGPKAVPGTTASAAAVVAAVPDRTTSPSPSVPFWSIPPGVIPSPGQTGVVVTAKDAGKTMRLTVGQTLTLILTGSAALPWRGLSNSAPAVLRQLPSPPGMLQLPGSILALFRARASGTARISAASVPSCLAQTPACAVPDRSFYVVADVTTADPDRTGGSGYRRCRCRPWRPMGAPSELAATPSPWRP